MKEKALSSRQKQSHRSRSETQSLRLAITTVVAAAAVEVATVAAATFTHGGDAATLLDQMGAPFDYAVIVVLSHYFYRARLPD